jgi:hypothetical protein
MALVSADDAGPPLTVEASLTQEHLAEERHAYLEGAVYGAAWPPDRRWASRTSEGLGAVVPLARMGCSLALREVYTRIILAPSEEEDLDGAEDRG